MGQCSPSGDTTRGFESPQRFVCASVSPSQTTFSSLKEIKGMGVVVGAGLAPIHPQRPAHACNTLNMDADREGVGEGWGGQQCVVARVTCDRTLCYLRLSSCFLCILIHCCLCVCCSVNMEICASVVSASLFLFFSACELLDGKCRSITAPHIQQRCYINLQLFLLLLFVFLQEAEPNSRCILESACCHFST